MYVKYAVKSSIHGRASGGVVVFVRSIFEEYIVPVDQTFDFGLAFQITNHLTEIPFILIFAYIPPFGSKVYTGNEPNGISYLEEYVNIVKNEYPESKLFLQ